MTLTPKGDHRLPGCIEIINLNSHGRSRREEAVRFVAWTMEFKHRTIRERVPHKIIRKVDRASGHDCSSDLATEDCRRVLAEARSGANFAETRLRKGRSSVFDLARHCISRNDAR
jgi:hypothetical protein